MPPAQGIHGQTRKRGRLFGAGLLKNDKEKETPGPPKRVTLIIYIITVVSDTFHNKIS